MKNTTRKQFVRSFFASPHCNPSPGPEPAKAEPPDPALYAVAYCASSWIILYAIGRTPEQAARRAKPLLPCEVKLSSLPAWPDKEAGYCIIRMTVAARKALRSGNTYISEGGNGVFDTPLERFDAALTRLSEQIDEGLTPEEKAWLDRNPQNRGNA
jgi:hypothetical protein